MITLYMRKTRRMVWSRRLWRQRLLFWSGAITIGVAAAYFAMAVDAARDVFDHYIRPYPVLPLLITPLAFAGVVWATRRYVPAARGSGIPQAIAARTLRDRESRHRLVGLRVILGKVVLMLIVIMAGASVGREGPTVQLGVGILMLFASFAGLSAQRGIVLAGSAAGVAAAFNTPLAGIVFAIEEMARAFEHRNSSIVLIAIVLSGAASMSILGRYDYFGYTNAALAFSKNWDAVIVIGLLGGFLGGVFSRLLTNGDPFLRHCWNNFGNRKPIYFAALCGVVVALLGIATSGLTYGSGYEMGHDLLHQQLDPVWWQTPAKLLATAASAVSGIPGGIFSPSLSVGAAFGADLSQWFPSTSLEGAILLGMVAYFAGVTQAPITAFVIVLEITGKATDPLPLIAAAVLAAGIARIISPTSLYHMLAKSFIHEKAPPVMAVTPVVADVAPPTPRDA